MKLAGIVAAVHELFLKLFMRREFYPSTANPNFSFHELERLTHEVFFQQKKTRKK